jgi:hypothetical protein
MSSGTFLAPGQMYKLACTHTHNTYIFMGLCCAVRKSKNRQQTIYKGTYVQARLCAKCSDFGRFSAIRYAHIFEYTRGVRRVIGPDMRKISTLAGTGEWGALDGEPQHCTFNRPMVNIGRFDAACICVFIYRHVCCCVCFCVCAYTYYPVKVVRVYVMHQINALTSMLKSFWDLSGICKTF